ncbi:hypothetical protein F2Q69_00029432 [Brassica cretica]|uniref:Uncharacterized protein n=1 Tax=Brassica cretica TaxID=69181 RepID=A0A8S9S010_BRACR|nr:hypothetical protein F2Q69_00029432 [Brassica cretica]
MFFRRNIGVVSTDPKTELRKLRTKMHGYGMGPSSEWSTENWPLARRANPWHDRASRPATRPCSPASRSATRPCSPGELARVMAELAGESTGDTACSPGELARVTAELAGDSTGNTAVLAGLAGSCRGRARRAIYFGCSFSRLLKF